MNDDREFFLRARVETACDGYANLMDDDVPNEYITEDYRAGARDAAEAIRAELRST